MMVAETKKECPIEVAVAPLYVFFPPFFFASIGLQLDLGAVSEQFFAAVVGMSILTTLVAPPALRSIARRADQS